METHLRQVISPALGIPSIQVSEHVRQIHRPAIQRHFTFTSPHDPPSAARLGSPLGSFHHYLLLSVRTGDGPEKVHVVNAITGRSLRIPVPPHSAINTATFYTPDSSVHNGVASDWITALSELSRGVVHVYRADGWSRMVLLPGTHKVRDLIFHRGRLFCVTREGEIVVFDISGRCSASNPLRPVAVIPERPVRGSLTEYNLVESCSGEVLLVTRHYLGPSRIGGPSTLTVHRVDEEKMELVRLRDLGEQMLFVGEGCSRSMLHGSVRSRPFGPSQFYTPNSIYFFFGHSFVDMDLVRGLGKFSMDEDECSNVSVLFHQFPLAYSYREPIWISKA